MTERDDYHRDAYDQDAYDGWDEPVDGDAEVHSRGLDFGLLLLRVGSLPLVARGLDKATDMPAFVQEVGSNTVGSQAPEFVAWLVMLGQVALPVLVAVGLFTRPAAFLLAAMTAAIWALTVPVRLDYVPMTPDGALTGEPALLFVALALPLVFTGAGLWSLDAMRTAGRP